MAEEEAGAAGAVGVDEARAAVGVEARVKARAEEAAEGRAGEEEAAFDFMCFQLTDRL